MKIEQWFAAIALIVSVLSLVTSLISLKRTEAYTHFDYATRLDIIDEIIQIGRPAGDLLYISNMGSGVDEKKDIPDLIHGRGGFGYRALLKNKGSKSIPIHMIFMDYGSEQDSNKRVKHVLDGKFNLAPNETRQLNFSLPLDEINQTENKYEISQCLFWLRVVYVNTAGKRLELIRKLGGFDGSTVSWTISAGDSLT